MFDERMDDFVRETGQEKPKVDHLSPTQCERLRATIASKLGLANSTDGALLVRTLRGRQRATGKMMTDPDFSLRRAFDSLGIKPNPFVFLNWAQFNLIDRFDAPFICRHLQDILYPGGDDVDLFDESFSWFVSVDYECRLLAFVRSH